VTTIHTARVARADWVSSASAFRKPFIPPTAEHPLIIRSITYVGEKHPAAAKRVIVVPVARLPLRDADAIHKFKLLAGARWSEQPPRDTGVGVNEDCGEHGYVKISTESFPEPAMNLKWGSDVLDRLIEEANDVRLIVFVRPCPEQRSSHELRPQRTNSRTSPWTPDIWSPRFERRRLVDMLVVVHFHDPPFEISPKNGYLAASRRVARRTRHRLNQLRLMCWTMRRNQNL
jgi:hypothetical protein